MARTTRKPLKVFCSYSHQDEHYLAVLKTWLEGLERDGLIEQWHDRMISPGQEWEEAIAENLETSDMVLLLVTPDFIASQYVYEKEIDRAIERHKRGEARVIPIIVRPAPWEGTALDRLQALPKNARAITTWANRDQAWLNVLQGIQQAVQELLFEPQPPGPEQSSEQIYREAVQWAWADRELHTREVERLSDLAGEYELSTDSASAIGRKVMGETKEGIIEHIPTAGTEVEAGNSGSSTVEVPAEQRAPKQPDVLTPETIFVSYSHKDWDEFVEPLVIDLRQRGLKVWIDQLSIKGGTDWGNVIDEALKTCQRMVVCVSPNSMISDEVKSEFRYFLRRHKSVYPLLCHEADTPYDLDKLQYISYEHRARLIEELSQ